MSSGTFGRTDLQVESGDACLRVHVTGGGTPLVLVHGWAMDHRVFRYQVEAFARHFRVVTFDRRGFGASSGSPGLARELDDLDAVTHAAIGDRHFHLLGISQGGRLALRYAATRPERLRSLIVQGAAVDGDEPAGPETERIPLDAYAALARAGRLQDLRDRWLRHPMMRLGPGHPEADRLLRDMLADYRGADLITHPEPIAADMDVLRELATTSLPVLVLTGDLETSARRRTAERLLAALPNTRAQRFRHSGHLCNLTEPEAYNRAVIAFCRSVDDQRAASGAGAED